MGKIEQASERAAELMPHLKKAYDKCIDLAQVKPIA